jgi:hypothetical protein
MNDKMVDKFAVHDYVPSPQHMGDCRICGHVQDNTIHGYPPRGKTVPEMLVALGDLYQKRNKLYKNNYKHFGKVMLGMFPDGLILKTEADFNRLAIFVQIASKMTRYGQQFADGGHTDSLDDVAVYSQMLQEYDREIKS